MSFIGHHIVLFIVLIIIAFVLAVGSAVLEAWLDIRQRPKEDMFWCSTCQQYFRKQHALKLFPDMPDSVQNSFVCPSCYYKAVFENPDKKLRNN
jgi:hypothetical protein